MGLAADRLLPGALTSSCQLAAGRIGIGISRGGYVRLIPMPSIWTVLPRCRERFVIEWLGRAVARAPPGLATKDC